MNESAPHIRDDANITMTRAPENRLEDNSLSITESTVSIKWREVIIIGDLSVNYRNYGLWELRTVFMR